MFIYEQDDWPQYRWQDERLAAALEELIQRCVRNERPLIVEGFFLLRRLKEVQLKADYLIYVENIDFDGSATWQDDFREYESPFKPKQKANFEFQRSDDW